MKPTRPCRKVTATALMDGKPVTKEVNSFGKIKLGEKPKLWVMLETNAEPVSTKRMPAACQPADGTHHRARPKHSGLAQGPAQRS